MNENKLIGLRIKELRGKKGLELGYKYTGKMLADALGISRSYLGDIESGRTKPSDELLEKIALTFGITLYEFSNKNNIDTVNENKAEYLTPMEKIDMLVKENKIETLAAHFEDEEFTDEDVEDIENFINYIISKKKNN